MEISAVLSSGEKLKMGDVEKRKMFLFKSVPSATLKMEANLRLDQICLVCLGGI